MLLVAGCLYFFSDVLLKYIEQRRGEAFEDRNVVFLGIFTVSLVVVFLLLDNLLALG